MCAAALGATAVGADRNASAFALAADDFAALALGEPTFGCGDVLSPAGPLLGPEAAGTYDAVVCDPPYGLRAGARKTGSRRAAADVKAVDEKKRSTHIPQTQPYAARARALLAPRETDA